MSDTEFGDFEAFWKHFLGSHQSAAVRWSHVAALGCAVAGVAGTLRTRRLLPLVLGGGAAAALAVLSHQVFEGHWPENFGRPAWAGRAFVRLCLRTVTGSISQEA